MDPASPRSSLSKTSLFILCLCALSCLLQAAPYQGESFTYRQPDGESFTVRLFGDEFFAYEETTDGYLVVKDPKTSEFCYARVIQNGAEMVTTGVRVGRSVPSDIKRKQRLAPAAAMAQSRIRRDLAGVDDEGGLKPELLEKLFPKPAKPNNRLNQPAPADIQFAPDGTSQYAPGDGSPDGTSQPAPIIPITVDKRIGLVLLASFPDRQVDINKTQAQIDNYCNADNYNTDGNATSVKGYFLQQSNGKLEYRCIVTAWFVAANNQSYYTDPNASGRGGELIKEGLEVLKAQNFDFRQCDADGNGVMDGVNCFYAGARTNTWGQGLWPSKFSVTWTGFGSLGLSATSQCQISDMPASLGIGTFCHENGHMLLNYPDLYQYNDSAADAGSYSLMAYYGSDKHPVNIDPALKISSGWAKVVDLDNTSHERCVVQADRNHFYRYNNPAKSGESFFFEVRTNAGYEGDFGGAARINPTSGLVVHHYLQSGSNTHSSIFTSANPNANYSTPYKLLVLEATPDAAVTPWYDDPSPDYADGFKSGGVSQLSDSTTPDLKFWAANGRTTASLANVHSISTASDTMSFVIGTGAVTDPTEIGITTDGLVSTITGGSNAPAQGFAVFNVGAGTLNYSVSVDAAWLSVSPASGSVVDGEIDKLTVNYSANGLSGGTHLAQITITSAEASNSPVTLPVTLHVNGTPAPPLFTIQPAGIHLLGDETYVLNSFATGSPDPTYQWYKNDVAINGAISNNLTLPNVTASAAGTYHVVATNSLGTVTSNDAVITVNDDPNIAWVTPLVNSIRLASNARLWLEANVTDDGYGGSSTTLSWTAPTVPAGGGVSWANQNTALTAVTFTGDGVYVLRFTVSDGENTRIRDIQVEVGNPSGNDTDLIALYRFAEKSGTVAYDSAGTQQNATLLGGASFSGGELVLDGSTGRVTIANSTDIDTGGPYPKRTIMAWVKRNADTAANQFLYEQGGSTAGMSVLFTQFNSITCRIWRNGGSSSFSAFSTTTSAIAPGTWFHIAVVLDATPGSVTQQEGVYKLYINGQLQASGRGVALDSDNNGIGLGGINGLTRTSSSSNGSGPSPLPGRINDFVLYNRALSAAEINDLATHAVVDGPVVDAGANATGVVQVALQLDGTISAGGMPDPASVSPQWTTVSGPGQVVYQNATTTDAIITADTAGSYVLRLSADDGEIRTFDEVTVTMSAANGPGYLSLGANSYTIAENGGSLQIPVRRTGGANGAVSVNYAATNGSATNSMDYAIGSGTLSWADQNTATQYITVNILNDLRIEGSENFSVNLSNPSGGATLGGISTSTVTITDDEIPDTILFRDEFTAASGTSLTSPASRATGTLASSITYVWTNTTGAVVDGMLNWDNNNSRNSSNEQTDATGSQNMRVNFDLGPHVAGKVWEVQFNQRVAWSHPLTFGLSDTLQTTPTWDLWDNTNFDFAAGSYGTSLRYDTDNEGGTNGYSQANNFPNTPNSIDTHHFRIRFDEPSGKIMLWLNGIKKLDLTTLDFESTGRYLCWAEPGNFAGAMDNLEIKVINTANGSPTWNGSPITTADGVEGTPYSASLTGLASDPNGDNLAFAKVSGPAWLSVAADGSLSGTPSGSNLGNNTFTVSVADEFSPAVAVTLNVIVRTRFQAWAGSNNFNGDANSDGIADGVTWLLGAVDSGENGIARLPDTQRTNDGALVLTFRCLNAANRGAATLSLQFSQDIGVADSWENHQVLIPATSRTDVTSGVVFVITPNGNHDEVVATVPVTAAGTSGKLFGRLLAKDSP